MSHTPWVKVFCGEVLAVSNWADAYPAARPPDSRTLFADTPNDREAVQRTVVLAQDADGNEEQLDLVNKNIWFRRGSQIAVLYGSYKGDKMGSLLYVENLDTQSACTPVDKWRGYGSLNGLGLALMAMAVCMGAALLLFAYTDAHTQFQLVRRTMPCNALAHPDCLPTVIPGTTVATSMYVGPEWVMDLQRKLLSQPLHTLLAALGAGFLAIWVGTGILLAGIRRKAAVAQRTSFVAQAISAAKEHGLRFTVADPMAMQFVRSVEAK